MSLRQRNEELERQRQKVVQEAEKLMVKTLHPLFLFFTRISRFQNNFHETAQEKLFEETTAETLFQNK